MRGKNLAKRKAFKDKPKGFESSRSAAVAEPTVEEVEKLVVEPSTEATSDITNERQKRAHITSFIRSDKKDRVIEFPFASEEPVERSWGNEILEITDKAMDMSRLNTGAPLLYQHDPDKIVGVVEKAYIKGKRGFARVKLANNELGREMQELISDNIIRNVSFGYKINELEADRSTEPVTYRATDYQPFELSLVTIPADFKNVGIGRTLVNNESKEAVSAVVPQSKKETLMEPIQEKEAAIRSEAAKANRKEVADMLAFGKRTKQPELAEEFISNGRSYDELRSAILEKIVDKTDEKPVNVRPSHEIGLTEKEARGFSFLRVMDALANPQNRQKQEDAAFELEVSKATEQKTGRQSRGFMVPSDVVNIPQKRDLVVGTASSGGDLVSTDLLSDSFIDLLRKNLFLSEAGITTLTGLEGMIAIPRQSGGATVYHVAENANITESQLTVDQVSLQPRTLGALTDFSRRLFIQSSIGVEQFVRNDLAKKIAEEIENQAINGPGAEGKPQGFLNVTGINTESGYTTFADYVNAEAALSTDNALRGNLGYIMNSSLRGTLKVTEKASGTNGIFVYEGNDTINGYRAFVSNNMPANTAAFVNFSDIILGLWSGLDIMVDPYTGSAAGTVRVTAMQDYDVAVRHPESICKLS